MIEERYYIENDSIFRELSAGKLTATSKIDLDLLKKDAFTRPPELVWWQMHLQGANPSLVTQKQGELTILDLFCGCGGLTLGVTEAIQALGLDPIVKMAVDVDDDGLDVYSTNFRPKQVLHRNVSSLVDFQIYDRWEAAEFAYHPELLVPEVTGLKGKVDLLVAGPPCQGHSNLNNHTRREDPRNLLYLSVVAIGVALDVKGFIIENVPDVVNDKQGVVQTARVLLEKAGYTTTDYVLAAHELGCAQTRRRHFTVATKGIPVQLPTVAEIMKKPTVGIDWAIGDLLDKNSSPVMDTVPTLSAENQRRIEYLFDEDLYDLPNEVRPDCHKNGHTYKSVYGRLRWNQPSGTITTGFLTPGRGRYIHPLRRRVLTPHEAARIQGFPDCFSFTTENNPEPNRTSLSKWIGDAVPPILGYTAASCALTGIFSEK